MHLDGIASVPKTPTNLDLTANNRFTVPVTVVLSAVDELKLHKFLNLHYLGDEEANELITCDNQPYGLYPKYPEKETDDFKAAVNRICQEHTVNLVVTYDVLGKATFELENPNLKEYHTKCSLKEIKPATKKV
jgi:hypothetical protein